MNRIYHIIDDNGGSGRVFNVLITLLIEINVGFIIADTFDIAAPWYSVLSRTVETISIVIFTAEYALRIATASLKYPSLGPLRARAKFITSGYAVIDLVAILPFYIPAIIPVDLRVLRVIRLLRIARIFKLGRYSDAMAIVGRVLKNSAPQLASSISVVGLLMVVSSILMYYIESPAQPGLFENAFSGLWWAVATLTTVGYGDIYPVTMAGKIVSAVIALLGIGLVAVPTGIISAGFMSEMESRKDNGIASAKKNDVNIS
jgi:voltage-gated potassium channel